MEVGSGGEEVVEGRAGDDVRLKLRGTERMMGSWGGLEVDLAQCVCAWENRDCRCLSLGRHYREPRPGVNDVVTCEYPATSKSKGKLTCSTLKLQT
jgi:hypothetical protein